MRILIVLLACMVNLQEVPKVKISATHLDSGLDSLPWNTAIWDVDDAIKGFKSKELNGMVQVMTTIIKGR